MSETKQTTNNIYETYFSKHGKKEFHQIVTINLFEGMELTNFDSLCHILYINTIPFGSRRQRYKEVFSCFFEWERIKPSFRIKINKIYPLEEIKEYKSPTSNGKTKTENHKPQRITYQKYILSLLEDYASLQINPYYIDYTSLELYNILGFANKDIQKLSNKVQSININHNLTSMMRYPVVFTGFRMVINVSMILNTLRSLQKKGYIDDFGQILYLKHGNGSISSATKDQIIQINQIRETVSKQIEKENHKCLCDKTLIQRTITQLTNEELYKDYQYKIAGLRYYIQFNKDKFMPERLSDEKRFEYRTILNNRVKNRMKTYLSGMAENIINKINEIESSDLEKNNKQKYTKEMMTRYNLIGRNPENLLNTFLEVLNEYTDLNIENIQNSCTDGFNKYEDLLSNRVTLS